MANTRLSTKRLQIDKATSTMVIALSIASFVAIFSIISSHTLLGVLTYQGRVITAKETAVNRLNQDITASRKLVTSFQNFTNASTNVLGGPTTGTAQNSGDNGKIVLDALPSTCDYPALTNSLQSLLSNQGVKVDSIGGIDQQATIGANGQPASSSGTTTTPTTTAVGGVVGMPFSFSVDGPYQNLQSVITTFEKSIRPFQIQTMEISGDQADVTMSVTAQTFYQPATTFNITQETVK